MTGRTRGWIIGSVYGLVIGFILCWVLVETGVWPVRRLGYEYNRMDIEIADLKKDNRLLESHMEIDQGVLVTTKRSSDHYADELFTCQDKLATCQEACR
jgi:hypothetical protein